jgi:segregation and condensation protein B
MDEIKEAVAPVPRGAKGDPENRTAGEQPADEGPERADVVEDVSSEAAQEVGEEPVATLDSVLGSASGPALAASDAPARPAVDENLKAIIEALVFASPEPLTPKALFKLLEHEPKEDVEAALDALAREYNGQGGLQLVEVAGGYQIVTRPELHDWVRRLFHERKTQKLTVQALETLAVIAYRQPITAPEIAEIRGVNTSGVLNTLLERHLIKIAGRKQVIGRPFLYATTREFLIRFGLRDLSDLPKMEDMAEVLGFEAPAGLADTGPATGTLPLEMEPGPDDETDPGAGIEDDAGPETVN